MKREARWPVPGRLKSATKRTLFAMLGAIARSHELTKTQRDKIETSYASTGAHLAEDRKFGRYVKQVHPQGSFVLGTMVRHPEFDIDSVARLEREAERLYLGAAGATQLLNDLHASLSDYGARHHLKVTRKKRCVQIEYAQGMHADITPVFDAPLHGVPFGDLHGAVPDRELRCFVPTNPRGYASWFSMQAEKRPLFVGEGWFAEILAKTDVVPLPDQQELQKRFLSQIVQVAKVHRNHSFVGREDDAPTSIFITTLLANGYERLVHLPHDDEFTFLIALIDDMPSGFERRGSNGDEWVLMNPTTTSENIASRMNTPVRQKAFEQWVWQLREDLCALAVGLDGGSATNGRDQLIAGIQRKFGSLAADAARTGLLSGITQARSNHLVIANSATGLIAMPSRHHTFHGQR